MNQYTWTPWGSSQLREELAPGIIRHSTASHGGIELSPDRQLVLQQCLPDFKPYAAPGWLEEDCDAAVAPLIWPDEFDSQEVYNAVRMVRHPHSGLQDVTAAFLASPTGARVLAIHDAFAATVADKWERGGCSTGGNGWSVSLRRQGQDRTVQFAEYPEKQFYTDAELAAAI